MVISLLSSSLMMACATSDTCQSGSADTDWCRPWCAVLPCRLPTPCDCRVWLLRCQRRLSYSSQPWGRHRRWRWQKHLPCLLSVWVCHSRWFCISLRFGLWRCSAARYHPSALSTCHLPCWRGPLTVVRHRSIRVLCCLACSLCRRPGYLRHCRHRHICQCEHKQECES